MCLKRRRDTKTPGDACFSCGVRFVMEGGTKAIRFIVMNGSVKLCPNSLRSRTELESRLRAYNLSLEGSATTLPQRFAQHLEQIVRMISHPDRVQIKPPLRNLAALCVASYEVLVCADNEKRAIFQVTLAKDELPFAESLKLVDYPADVAAIESLVVCGRLVYFVSA